MEVTVFKKGSFIVQDDNTNLFAIFSGTKYSPSKKEDSCDYGLISYFDLDNMECETSDNGVKVYYSNPIVSVGMNGEDCEYIIHETSLKYWRLATASEVKEILNKLAEKNYAYDIKKNTIRLLSPNEKAVIEKGSTPNTITIKYKSKITTPKKKRDKQKKDIHGLNIRSYMAVKNACNIFNNLPSIKNNKKELSKSYANN